MPRHENAGPKFFAHHGRSWLSILGEETRWAGTVARRHASSTNEDPAHRSVLESLQAKLKNFQRETNDPWLLKWERE